MSSDEEPVGNTTMGCGLYHLPHNHFFEIETCGALTQADAQRSHCLSKTAPSLEYHFREIWTPQSYPKWYFK